jgi:DNA-binding NarL/FixJ family response regulator
LKVEGGGSASSESDDAFGGGRGQENTAEMAAAAPRVLIVDDQASFRGVARLLLEWRGYEVAGEAGDAAEAIDCAERLAPDAVLLDVGLGEDSGFEVCSALVRARPALAVLLVSDADYTRVDGCVAASGARGFALKSRLAAIDLAAFWPSPVPA